MNITGKLYISAHKASALKSAQMIGRMSPYIRFEIANHSSQSPPCGGDRNPDFKGHTSSFLLEEGDKICKMFIWNKRSHFQDTLVGMADLNVEDLKKLENNKKVEIKLKDEKDKPSGSVFISSKWEPIQLSTTKNDETKNDETKNDETKDDETKDDDPPPPFETNPSAPVLYPECTSSSSFQLESPPSYNPQYTEEKNFKKQKEKVNFTTSQEVDTHLKKNQFTKQKEKKELQTETSTAYGVELSNSFVFKDPPARISLLKIFNDGKIIFGIQTIDDQGNKGNKNAPADKRLCSKLKLAEDEHITKISGSASDKGIVFLEIGTSKGVIKHYGGRDPTGEAVAFNVYIPDGTMVVGFHGSFGTHSLHSIGVITAPEC